MVKIQKRILVGLEVLQYFTTREWRFHNNKMITMFDELSPEDKKMFLMYGNDSYDKIAYIKNCILGTRQYCMKENLSSLPRARRHQKM